MTLEGSRTAPTRLAPGAIVADKLEVVRRVGEGGVGAVYEVVHRWTKHRRAMKVLHPEAAARPTLVERFFREASAAGRIGNAHIAETFDVGRLAGGEPFLLMELLEGETLSGRIARGGLSAAELVDYVSQACNGVDAAHRAGIVHRDLKPENLFLTLRDGRPFLKILDFGASRFEESGSIRALTNVGALVGTPFYMPPEQLDGRAVDARTDVYALGVIAYECASGRRPFNAATLAELVLLVQEAKPAPLWQLRPDLPPELVAAIARAMHPNPEARFPSARSLAEALAASAPPSLAAVPRSMASEPRTLASAPPAATEGTDALALVPGSQRPLAGKYRLLRQLGQGGMGSIWLAEHLTLRSHVAIKLLDAAIAANPEGLARFLREAQAAASLRSPHVVQIIDYGVDAGVPFIAMEVLEGESLAARLRRVGRLSLAEAAVVVTQVARAMTRAHAAGVVHRDLKPDNVFIVHNDEEEVIKVLDFGVAKSSTHALGTAMPSGTRTGSMLGTPYYMSPEQAVGNKDLDHRTDIWALGVITWECLLGVRPFQGETLGGLMMAICEHDLPVPSRHGSVPAGFDAWFSKACARDVQQRFSTTKDAATELRRLCGQHADVAAPMLERPAAAATTILQPLAGTSANLGLTTPPQSIPKRPLIPLTALALGTLVVFGVGGTLFLLRGRGAEAAPVAAAAVSVPSSSVAVVRAPPLRPPASAEALPASSSSAAAIPPVPLPPRPTTTRPRLAWPPPPAHGGADGAATPESKPSPLPTPNLGL